MRHPNSTSSIHTNDDMSGAENTTDFTQDAFVKIGGPLPDASDPRVRKNVADTSQGNLTNNSRRKARVPTNNSNRLFYLRVIDSRKWHYSEAFALFMDFFASVLAVSFSEFGDTFHGSPGGTASRYFSSGLVLCYFMDMAIRILGLRGSLLRSHSNIADLLCVIALAVILVFRYLPSFNKNEGDLCLAYLTLLAMRLILKPRARTFSKKLHKFRSNGDHIRVSVESLRASLARIPGVTALAIEMMERDLVIICGRDSGDITRDELIRFLERALHYRPSKLSATEFLAHLRDIDASSSHMAYGTVDVVRSTLWHWSNQWLDLIFCFFVVCINAAITPGMAYFLSQLSDAFSNLQKEEGRQPLYTGVIGLLGLCVPFVVGNYAIGYFQSKMISKASELVQSALLDIILHQDTQFFAERSEGDLNNLFSSDVARVNALWQAVFWNLFNPLMGVVFGLGYAMYMDYPIGVMSFTFAAVLLSSGPQGFAAQRSKRFGSKNAYVAAEFQNAVSCHKLVRAYAIQEPLMERFRRTCASLRKDQFSKDFWSSIVQIYIESAMYIFSAIISASLVWRVWRDALVFNDNKITAGDFFGFVTLLGRVSQPVTVLGGFMRVAIGNASSLQRIDDVILGLGTETVKKNDDHDELPPLPKMQTSLKVEKLAFKYDKSSENYVLNGLSASIPKGAYVCVVGPSGCGKSTLLSCLMQFQEPDGGCVRMDEHDIFNFSKKSFMDQTAVVFQDGGILNGTIYDNIRYGNITASDADCEEAARLAECHFIRDLRHGFNTIVGQHATVSLSGGQAQRICLARALCRKPSLLLLDEATSALDPETEAQIVAMLERLAHQMDMTIISVTHRLSTAINADIIFVLNQGKVAEEGRYDDLLDKHGLFYEMIHKRDDDNSSEKSDGQGGSNKGAAVREKKLSQNPSNLRFAAGQETNDSSKALHNFTRKLSSRVGQENEGSHRGVAGNSWYRYAGNLSHLNRQRTESQESYTATGTRRSGRRSNRSRNVNESGDVGLRDRRARNITDSSVGSSNTDEKGKYFVL